MTNQDAGKLYLSAVCPTNALNNTWNNEVKKLTTFEMPMNLVAPTRDLAASFRQQAKLLTSPGNTWPAAIRQDIADRAVTALEVAAYFDGLILNAYIEPADDALYAKMTATAGRIRTALNLDAIGTCP